MSTRAPVVPLTRKRRNTNPDPPPKTSHPVTRSKVDIELPKVYLPSEAAVPLKVSRRTVERYIERGLIRTIRFAGRNLITEDELARVLRDGLDS